MARFRPGRLFRRLSSRGDRDSSPNDNNNINSSPPSTAASSNLPSPSARIPAYAASSPQGVRKTRSLPKLRKKLATGNSDIPEVVKEQRESLHLLPGAEVQSLEDSGSASRSTSASVTLGEGRSEERVVLASEEEKAPEVKEEEIRLPEAEEEVPRQQPQPAVVVQAPTPDVAEQVRAVQQWPVGASQEQTPEEPHEQAPGPKSVDGDLPAHEPPADLIEPVITPTFSPEILKRLTRPGDGLIRRPSLIDSANAKIVKTLLDSPFKDHGLPSGDSIALATSTSRDLFSPGIPDIKTMVQRKIWVKRPGASATLVQIREDDLVDDVREMILRKYANSLGKTFDAPDMTLSIATRVEQGQQRQERTLGPEEEICRTLDSYYPGGQMVDEALIINVPQRRTPRPSPKVFQHPSYQALEDYRPLENGTDYFPPMPAVIPPTVPQTSSSHDSRSSQHHHPSVGAAADAHPRSISVLSTGQIPPLPLVPSPGGTSRRHQHRPKYHRQPTSSPTILSHPGGAAPVAVNPPMTMNPPIHPVHRASTRPRLDSSAASEAHALNGIVSAAPPLLTPPASEGPPPSKNTSNPPTPSGGTTNPQAMRPGARPRRSRKPTPEDRDVKTTQTRGPNQFSAPSVNTALDNAAVPPINVLIVEDNIINLRILEGLMKRLKVRWQTAMNGQIAVDKWRNGGFHLVLMDIQMPVMSGLQAAREIRRLERVNGIGVFGELESPLSATQSSGGAAAATTDGDSEDKGNANNNNGNNANPPDDKLLISEGLFKSPVIIVALTASSLQSDRHEALAAGCNDFLNKPVNLVWLERKVKEWGCMQALIDYDGWRQWKDYAAAQEAGKTEEQRLKEREKEEKQRIKAQKMQILQEKQAKAKEEKKRQSLNGEGPGAGGAEAVNEATAVLKTGAECLKEANFEV